MGSGYKGPLRAALAGLFLWLSAALPALAQLPSTQCVSTALAGGTGDALVIPRLPCQQTTTLLMLVFSATNTSNHPTLQQAGFAAYPIVQFDGSVVPISTFAHGQMRLLTFDGSRWVLLTGSNPGSVSQVALQGDNVLYNSAVSGSPITTIGTFDLQASLKNINRNLVLAGPVSGAAAHAAFRPLALADLPTLPLPVSVVDYGASTALADNSAQFGNAFAANCGKAVLVPVGVWNFTAPVPQQSCGVQIVGAGTKATILNFAGITSPSTFQPMLSFAGSEGSTTSLTADAVSGSLNVAVSSTAGFCASGNEIATPGCFVRVGSNALWDPGTLNHKRGELKPICFISGSNLQLCEPLEDTYLVSDGAVASPVTMIGGIDIGDLSIKGLSTANNAMEGIYTLFAYFPRIHDNEYYYLGGEGAEIFDNAWHPVGAFSQCYGLGALSAGPSGDAYCFVDDNATEFSQHDHQNCYESGPCYTAGFDLAEASSTRHVWVTNGISHNLPGLNSYAYQTHSVGAYFHFEHLQVTYDIATPAHANCFGAGVPLVSFVDVLCQNSPSGILISNYTNGSGTPYVENARMENITNDCIAFVQTPTAAPGIPFAQIDVLDFRVDTCGKGGIRLYNSNTSAVTKNIHIANGNIDTVGVSSPASNYPYVYLQNASGVSISSVTMSGLSDPAGNGALLENVSSLSMGNVDIEMPANATFAGVRLFCATPGSGIGGVIDGSSVTGTTPVNLRGIYIDDNCQQETIGANNLLNGTTLPFHLGIGTGNRSNYPLYGTSASLGGSPMTAGTCQTDTVTVNGVAGGASISAGANPTSDPGDSFYWRTSGNSTDNEVILKLCAVVAGTPTASTYGIAVSSQVNP